MTVTIMKALDSNLEMNMISKINHIFRLITLKMMMITMMTVKTMHDDHLGPPCDKDRLFPCTSLCCLA